MQQLVVVATLCQQRQHQISRLDHLQHWVAVEQTQALIVVEALQVGYSQWSPALEDAWQHEHFGKVS